MCYTKDSNFLDSFLISSFLILRTCMSVPGAFVPGIFLPFFNGLRGNSFLKAKHFFISGAALVRYNNIFKVLVDFENENMFLQKNGESVRVRQRRRGEIPVPRLKSCKICVVPYKDEPPKKRTFPTKTDLSVYSFALYSRPEKADSEPYCQQYWFTENDRNPTATTDRSINND